MVEKLLEGIKVADFSRVIVGPLTAKTLCDYGAEVIKIEGKSRLGHYRTTGPEPDLSAHFTSWNTGKLSIALNLTLPRGLEVAKKIVAWADIVVESFAGGSMKRMGLGYEVLKEIKPDIIMLSSCMQGQTGPFSRHPGWGFQLSGLSGFNIVSGWPDREPPELGVYTDFIAPQFNVVTILAALLYRRRTGKGMYIDMSQYENAVHFMAPLILDYTANRRVANRMGNRSDYASPHNAYRCLDADRYCTISISTDEEWENFCKAIENPAWTQEPRFSTPAARKENAEELHRLIEEWTANYSVEEVLSKMAPAGVTASRVLTGQSQVEHKPSGAYRCRGEDRWCAIAVSTDEEWGSFCKVIGNPAWTKDTKFSTLLARKENGEELDRLVEEWTIKHSAEEVMTLMQAAGVAAGVLETGEDQLEHDPQFKHRHFFREVDHAKMGVHHPTASPFILSKSPCEVGKVPLLGEHNEYILTEILGYSDEEIAELVIEGAVE